MARDLLPGDMVRARLHALVATAVVVAAGCGREDGPARDADGVPADAAVARADTGEGTQDAHLIPSDAGLDELELRETALEYMARRGDSAPFAPGEIVPAAVGPVASCIACHGEHGEGIPALATPRIGGMAAWYLARQLKYFHQGARGATIEDVHGTQMRAVLLAAGTYSEGLEDLAGYFSTFEPPPAPALESGDVAHGEQLYAVCVACHGADGNGSAPLNTPGLVEQDGEYLVRQLEHFRTGIRGSDPRDIFGQQMRPIVLSVITNRQDAVDVVSYIATLRAD